MGRANRLFFLVLTVTGWAVGCAEGSDGPIGGSGAANPSGAGHQGGDPSDGGAPNTGGSTTNPSNNGGGGNTTTEGGGTTDEVGGAGGSTTTGPEVCGNGTCGAGETCSTCAPDCGSCCPNGLCDNGETNTTCPQDCVTTCPNGVCDAGEDTGTCPADCSTGDCDHDPCDEGGPLDPECAPCAFFVCGSSDPLCCLLEWDADCVQAAVENPFCGC